MKTVYFIGIGGIGISALARHFKSEKWKVSGSDVVKGPITESLKKEGIDVHIGHRKRNMTNIDFVVFNRAIPRDNPELTTARKLGIRTLPYARVLGTLTERENTIAITGSHGKSTTTALVALALIKTGFDPTVMIGTNLKEFGNKNFRKGRGKWLVLEADDFGAAFLEYSPTVAVVTNIDKEHLDFYKSFSNLKNAFLKFLARTKPGGALVLNRDDKALRALGPRIARLAKKNKLRVIWFSLRDPETRKIKNILYVPGKHNLSNALAAYAVARMLKTPERKALSALAGYRGSWRRMEYRGRCQVSGVRCQVFDDYAHHPTEIKASLRAFKEKFPKSLLLCVFQPHQTERLRLLFKEFITAFDLADMLILLPVYKVPGRDRNTDQHGPRTDIHGLDSKKLALAIKGKYPTKPVFYLKNPKKIKTFIMDKLNFLRKSAFSPRQSALVVMMGAGDIWEHTEKLLTHYKK